MPVDDRAPVAEDQITVTGTAQQRAWHVRQLQDHHRARLDEVVAVVAAADGCTTFEVAERLTWSRPWEQSQGLVRRSAIGETYAHLLHLERKGILSNTENPSDHWSVIVKARPASHN